MIASRPPLRWRIFAVFMLISVLPYETIHLFGTLSAYGTARYVVDSIGVAGLTGYVFGRGIGPQSFWRMFAPVFIVFSVTVLLAGLIPFAAARMLPSMMLGILMAFLLLGIAVTWAMSLALLRYGGWRDGGMAGWRPPGGIGGGLTT